MATALNIINKALSLIGVRSAEVALSSTEISDALDTLNDLMAEWDASGLKIGFSAVSSSSDDIGAPDWALAAIKANLAIRLAPEYGRPISPSLAVYADSTKATVVQMTTQLETVYFPDTLPVGSGNNCGTYRNGLFFGGGEDDLLYESGQSDLNDTNDQYIQEDE